MTREEQRIIRELKKPLKQTCKETGKRRKWKTIAECQYQVRDGVLYMLYVTLSAVNNGRALKAWLSCKPVGLDELFWEIFHMKEEAAKMPFSFHVNGAFTAPVLTLDRWKQPLPSPEELDAAVEAVFDQAEDLVEQNPFPDLAAYRARWENLPPRSDRALSIVLCLLGEGGYQRAMDEIDAALARHDDGGFLRMNGKQGIMEDARDWCAVRLAEQEDSN